MAGEGGCRRPGFDAVGGEHEGVEGGVFVHGGRGGAVVEVLAGPEGESARVGGGRGGEDFLLGEALLGGEAIAVVQPCVLLELVLVLLVDDGAEALLVF